MNIIPHLKNAVVVGVAGVYIITVGAKMNLKGKGEWELQTARVQCMYDCTCPNLLHNIYPCGGVITMHCVVLY